MVEPRPAEPPAFDATQSRRWLVLSVLAVLVHLLALYLPGSAPEPSPLVGVDKLVHIGLFAVPVYCLGRLSGRVGLVAAVFGAHAVMSELIQWRFIPFRDGDAFDGLADLIGIGIAVWALTRGRRKRR